MVTRLTRYILSPSQEVSIQAIIYAYILYLSFYFLLVLIRIGSLYEITADELIHETYNIPFLIVVLCTYVRP